MVYVVYDFYTYLACSAKAMTPLSKGVAALVPVNDSVHLLFSVVVGYIKK